MPDAPSRSQTRPPSDWVARWATMLPAGAAMLDVACGSGRHTALFLDRGHPVTAIDRDVSRLAPAPGLEIVEADLEDGSPWPLPGRRFGAVVVTNYLYRPLFPALIEALAPGGVLIYETFSTGNERYGKPNNPAFLLADGELLEAVRGKLRVVAYESGFVDNPPRVVQRIAAVNAEAGTLPAVIPPPG